MAARDQSGIAVLCRAGMLVLFAVMLSAQASAQLTLGDYLKMSMNGTLGYGYSASYGDKTPAHAQNIVGNGTLTGSYYNPNFLSFSVRPFWDRSQSNSMLGAIAHDSGVDSTVSLFSGSAFPIGISYGKMFNSTNQFGIPGISSIVTNGSGQSFGLTWSELLPDYPPVWMSFSKSSSEFSALGSEGRNHTSTKDFMAGTNYQWGGFNLTGNFSHGSSDFHYTDLIGFESSGDTSLNSYSFGAQHSLPLRGSLGLNYGHTSYDSSVNGGTSGTTNMVGATTNLMPWNRLSLSGNAQYTTNVFATLGEGLTSGGGGLGFLSSDTGTHSLMLSSGASLSIGHGWSANGTVTRTGLSFAGRDIARTQYGGTVNFHHANELLGLLHFSVGLVDMANQNGNSGLAMVGNIGIDHKFGGWETSGDFGYSQDVTTSYGLGVTSSYTYGGSLRRRFNRNTYWGGSYRAAHSGLSQLAGSSSASQSVSSSFSRTRYSFSGSYSDSRGTSVLTSSGILTPTPVVGLITDNLLLFDGRSYSFTGSTTLFRRIGVYGTYSRARSTIEDFSTRKYAESTLYNARFEYRLRKMSLTGGYSRINQDATAVKTGPTMLNSFYVSFSRWFNVF